MRIAREYGERLKSKLLKSGALDRLVQDYPSHGFVIDKEEALQYFTKVDDLTPDEMSLAEFLEDFDEYVRWPKDNPEVFDVSTFFERIRKMEEKRAADAAKASAAQAPAAPPAQTPENQATQPSSAAPNTIAENTGSANGEGTGKAPEETPNGDAAKDDGRGSSAQATQSAGQGANVATAPINGNG